MESEDTLELQVDIKSKVIKMSGSYKYILILFKIFKGHVSNGLAWYINGFLIPELWLRRGLTYAFKVIIRMNNFSLINFLN